MISMVDSDGDGQVSFQEFRTLVLHPNPGMIDVHKEVTKAKEEDIAEDRNALAGKFKSTDLSAYQRQKEMTQREAKKKMLVTYVVDNEVIIILIIILIILMISIILIISLLMLIIIRLPLNISKQPSQNSKHYQKRSVLVTESNSTSSINAYKLNPFKFIKIYLLCLIMKKMVMLTLENSYYHYLTLYNVIEN